jgi:hypothetical protein
VAPEVQADRVALAVGKVDRVVARVASAAPARVAFRGRVEVPVVLEVPVVSEVPAGRADKVALEVAAAWLDWMALLSTT